MCSVFCVCDVDNILSNAVCSSACDVRGEDILFFMEYIYMYTHTHIYCKIGKEVTVLICDIINLNICNLQCTRTCHSSDSFSCNGSFLLYMRENCSKNERKYGFISPKLQLLIVQFCGFGGCLNLLLWLLADNLLYDKCMAAGAMYVIYMYVVVWVVQLSHRPIIASLLYQVH